MAQDNDELAHWELRIADLERRVADHKRRVAHEGGEALGSREVLHLLEQTLDSWRTHRRSLQHGALGTGRSSTSPDAKGKRSSDRKQRKAHTMARRKDLRTIAASNGIATDAAFGAVTPPIYLSSTFAFAGFEQSRTHDYSRTANPSRDMLADTLAKLEGGSGAVVVSSGMAAVDLVLSQLGPHDLVVAPHDCYGGTHRLLSLRRDRKQFGVIFVDQNDETALSEAMGNPPSLVLIETPSNPLMRVVDIRAIVARAKSVGAKVGVDNTFLSPALQRPILMGADFVIHSTTKYLNGHSDVVGGAVVAAEKADAEALATWANITGVTGSPFDSYLTLRGVRTLFPRVERQQLTAAAVAEFLHNHPRVSAVYYPGLASDPGHAIAKAQQSGFGAMLSFELSGGVEAVRRFVEAVRIFTLAESLGGIESLVAHPATMTHVGMGAEARRVAGITDGLLRLSIGLEAEADLIEDLERALIAAGTPAEVVDANNEAQSGITCRATPQVG